MFAFPMGSFRNLSARIVCKYKCIVGVIWKASHNFTLNFFSFTEPTNVLRHGDFFGVTFLFQIPVTSLKQTSTLNLPTPYSFFTLILRTSLQILVPKRHLGTLALEWERLGLDPSSTVCDLEQVI